MYVWIHHYISQNKFMHSYLQTLVVMQQKQCLAIPYLQVHHLAAWYLWYRENPVTRFRVWSGANMQRSGSWRKRFTLYKDRQLKIFSGVCQFKALIINHVCWKVTDRFHKFWILEQPWNWSLFATWVRISNCFRFSFQESKYKGIIMLHSFTSILTITNYF